MGSSSTATVFSSIASRIASAEPYFTTRNPGVNGPKPPYASGSLENPTIVVVRPWKLFSMTMMFAWSLATPLTS